MARPELAKCLAFLRKGDTLVVTKPDRLARNLRYMLQIEEALTRRGIHLIVMSMGGFRLDTANPTNKLLMQILAGVAEWERAIMRERQRGGIDRARALRKYAGRKPISPEKTKKVLDGLELGMSKKQAAEYAGCGLTTVYRIVWGGHTPPVLPPAYPKSWEKDKRGYLKEFAVPTRPIPVEKLLGL
jgi:DNA invertase Pin-like site-specific DNA recombinase